jgi:hypothetical protein
VAQKYRPAAIEPYEIFFIIPVVFNTPSNIIMIHILICILNSVKLQVGQWRRKGKGKELDNVEIMHGQQYWMFKKMKLVLAKWVH